MQIYSILFWAKKRKRTYRMAKKEVEENGNNDNKKTIWKKVNEIKPSEQRKNAKKLMKITNEIVFRFFSTHTAHLHCHNLFLLHNNWKYIFYPWIWATFLVFLSPYQHTNNDVICSTHHNTYSQYVCIQTPSRQTTTPTTNF